MQTVGRSAFLLTDPHYLWDDPCGSRVHPAIPHPAIPHPAIPHPAIPHPAIPHPAIPPSRHPAPRTERGAHPFQPRNAGVRRVHPAFRVIACAEPPTAHDPWLTDELLSLFSFHSLPDLTPAEQRQLVCFDAVAPASRPPLLALLRYEKSVREAVGGEPTLRIARLSNRQLLRAKRHLASRPDDAEGALRRASAAALLAMPPAARETARTLLEAAVTAEGLQPQSVLKGNLASPTGADLPRKPSAAAQAAARRDLKQLEDQASTLPAPHPHPRRIFPSSPTRTPVSRPARRPGSHPRGWQPPLWPHS